LKDLKEISMPKSLVGWGFRVIGWALAATGVVALLITAFVAMPLTQPPMLASISDTSRAIDRSTMPGLERFQARDGTTLAYRHYAVRAPSGGRIAILVHGSSGSSTSVHALADALAEHGVETYAVDIRGHGASGTRGDIAYLGQLEDDLQDLVAVVRQKSPNAPLTLIGHSAGGGFALRAAGSPLQHLFVRTVLLAPYLGPFAPTNRPNSGGWASPDMPRILALVLLRRIGIDCCEALPVLAFAVPPNSERMLVPAYTERLRSNFATHLDYRTDLAAVTRPLTIFSGADDELMLADKYAEAVRDVAPSVDVKLIEGVNHIGIVGAPKAVSVIADDVATAGTNS
jgi:alpha-beta hydrolase superfamily lysophospholipase